MASRYETLALKFAPELYYKKSESAFENISPEDFGGLYWRLAESPHDEVCIQYIAYFKQQRWVPGIFDRFSGKMPGEHPNDYVPIFCYFKDANPVKATFDICHYEAVGIVDDPEWLPPDRNPRFHIRKFYRGVLPLKETTGYSLLTCVPRQLSQERLTQWWKGLTPTGSYHEEAKLIIRKKLENPFQEITTFRDSAGKLGFLFDLIFRSALEFDVRGPPLDAGIVASHVEEHLDNKQVSHKDIEDIIEQSGVQEYLALRGYKRFQKI
jgi:hypothetical protein